LQNQNPSSKLRIAGFRNLHILHSLI